MYAKLSRKELAAKLAENRKVIDYVNPSDKHFWPHTYLVILDTGCYVAAVFLVHASSLADAHDEIADYCDKVGYAGLFADPEYIEELHRDAIENGEEEEAYIDEQFTAAGNEGKYFCNIGMVYELA